MYELQEILEARRDAGVVLTKEEESLLVAARRVTSRYERDGRRKFSPTKTAPG
jgi:hypothetical protein